MSRSGGFLELIAHMAIVAPKRTLGLAAVLLVAAGAFGIPVAERLSAGGFEDPTSESARATATLRDAFDKGDSQLMFLVTAPAGVDSPAARSAGGELAEDLIRSPHVTGVTSAWTVPPSATAPLVSADGTSGLVVADINTGADADAVAAQLSNRLARDDAGGGVRIQAGGIAMVNAQITEQAQHDILVMEAVALPLSFLVLIWVFGGLWAAALPVVIGGMSILGSLAVLRAVTYVTDVSIFALNLTTALGLALAIDYTLLIISRFRAEVAGGADRDAALFRTMATAGRTVLFSATTVALSMAAMSLFPMPFLKSFGYAGVATVAFTAIAAILLTPAAIVALGHRLDALDARALLRRLGGRHVAAQPPIERQFWYRSTRQVMRHALPIGLTGVAVLLLLGTPFLGVRWGFPDDRVLPASASAREVGDRLRSSFLDDTATAVSVVLPDARDVTNQEFSAYAAALSRVDGVTAVSAPVGTFAHGDLVGPTSPAAGIRRGSALLTVGSRAPLFSETSETQLDALHAVTPPRGRAAEFTGAAQTNRDSVDAIVSRLPLVLGVIAVVTSCLLFLLTGSVVLPVKALLLNVLSLTAAFGAMVWIFQDHHLGGLGTTSTGTLVANMPVLLFCIAFGLAMDYEVFVVSRIREHWVTSRRTTADAIESVAQGVARTGRVVTAAALVMSISFAALISSQVSFMRMFGVGLTLAVLVDATLVRTVLLPASMRLLGTRAWWAPSVLTRLHDRVGVAEAGGVPAPPHARGHRRNTHSATTPTAHASAEG